MPSETMDFKSLSSSLYSFEDIWSPTKKQAGLWKSDNLSNCYDSDQGTGPDMNKQTVPSFSESSEVDVIATRHESSLFSTSLSELFSTKMRLSANNNALYGHSIDTVASQYEEEMLSGSLEELEAQTIGNLLPNDDDDLLAGLTDGHDHIIQDSAGDDVDELDLFTSVGGIDLGDDESSPSRRKNSKFLDGACNGQLELCNGSIAGEHPSRTLFVRNINSGAEDSELKALFEQFGDIHTLPTACKQCGFVMISYYDIRSAQNAMRAHRNGFFSFRKFDIHYPTTKDNLSRKNINQGTLAVFLYDSSVSNDELHRIFNVYGEIKEIRENPQGQHHKLIEFYDVRAAEAALLALNRNGTSWKRLKVEPSRHGDSKMCMFRHVHLESEQKEYGLHLHQNNPPLKSPTSFLGLYGAIKSGSMDGERIPLETSFRHGVSSSVPNTLPSLLRVKPVGDRSGIMEYSSPRELNFDIQAATTCYPHSLPECHDGLVDGVLGNPPEMTANINLRTQERIDNMQFCQINSNGHAMEFNGCGNGGCPLPGYHYKWSNSYQTAGMKWPNPPSYFDGICAALTPPRFHGLSRSPSHMMSTFMPINNQHVASAPAVNYNIWNSQHAYAGESPEASVFHPGSLGHGRFSSNAAHCVDLTSHDMVPHFVGSYFNLQVLPKNVGLEFRNQRGMMFPGRNWMINSFGTHKGRARSHRNEGGLNPADNKLYELDIDRIKKEEDNRTTLMLKNIPNKYTSKMLLAVIDECHKGTYDFVYLPIDFKNKCNVGYAFINMINPSLIIPFYQVFNGMKWEKFHSEKVASLAYARIQGKAALIAHFQNSSLMNVDKRCRPILFNTDGPNAGDEVPFPVGVNVRNKSGRSRNNTLEDKLQGSPPNSETGRFSSS